jgi:hypothetical protein
MVVPTAGGEGDETRHTSILYTSIAALSLAGAGVVLLGTSRYGVGISPDSANYLSAAQHLLAGEGLRSYDGEWYAAWPPLFPLCLAAVGLTGIDLATAARFLNAFALGATVFIGGLMLARCLSSKRLVLLGTLAILLYCLLAGVWTMAWTEPVFLLLIFLFLLYMPAFLIQRRASTLVVVSILAALSALQRYLGVAPIAGGAVLILLFPCEQTVRRRIKSLACFLAISCVPSAIWAARNYVLTSTLSGRRFASIYSLKENVTDALTVVSRWFVPDVVPLSVRAGVLGLIMIVGIAAVTRVRRDDPYLWLTGVLTLIYVPLLVYMHQVGIFDERMNDRYLSPVLVLMVCFFLMSLDRLTSVLRSASKPGPVLSAIVVIAAAIWLLYPAVRVYRSTVRQMHDGAGGYTVTSWKKLPLTAWLREHHLTGSLCSNAPDALYTLTGSNACLVPRRSDGPARFRERLLSDPNQYLVWFSSVRRPYIYDLDEMISMFDMEKVETLGGGVVYRLQPTAGSGSWRINFARPVYRLYSAAEDRHVYVSMGNETDRSALPAGKGWVNEGIAFYVHSDEHQPPGAQAIHRFVSASGNACFATDASRPAFADWTDEGIAWYAYPEDAHPPNSQPVYRFLSPGKVDYFYTASDSEKAKLIDDPAHRWTYDGIGWYSPSLDAN